MSRSLWRGAISFGLVYIPVQLFTADQTHSLDLTMLDKRDFSPIGYKKVNKKTDKEVAAEHIVKGFEFQPEEYVVLSDEDLRRANVKATQTIEILSFVSAKQIPPIFYERPYYVAPSRGGEKVYWLLYTALQRSEKAAIAQVVIRTKQYLVALLPVEGKIVLNTLRYANEIRPAQQIFGEQATSKASGLSEKEIDMALSLVDGMTEDWNPSQYRDSYKEDVMNMVQQKIEHHETKTITEPARGEQVPRSAEIIDLMSLLKESINAKQKSTEKRSIRNQMPSEKSSKAHSQKKQQRVSKRA